MKNTRKIERFMRRRASGENGDAYDSLRLAEEAANNFGLRNIGAEIPVGLIDLGNKVLQESFNKRY